MSNHNDIMCEVEIDSNMVEVVDNETFSDMGVVSYDHYEVRTADDDQYEEVTCENDDSQGLLLQHIDDEEVILQSESDIHEEVLDASGDPLCVTNLKSHILTHARAKRNNSGANRNAPAITAQPFVKMEIPDFENNQQYIGYTD